MPGLRFAYRIVDVFTDRPLAGNALCVVLDAVPAPAMQALAREVNLSETTFPVVTGDGEYDVRIFTPRAELAFAGHPTLGTAWVLGAGRWVQRSEGATVTVTADEHGAEMAAPDPSFEEVEPDRLVAALGLPAAEGAWLAVAGVRLLVVPTTAPLERLAPDLGTVASLTEGHGAVGVAVARPLDEATVHARVFLPAAGIAEDPGTGSAAGPLGVLCRQRFGLAERLTVRQGDEVGRPCRISVVAAQGGVRVGGGVVASAEGWFTL